MRYAGVLLALLLSLTWAAVPARAAEAGEVERWQQEQGDILQQAAREAGSTAKYGTEFSDALGQLADMAAQAFPDVLQKAVRSGVLLMVILLLCALAESLSPAAGGTLRATGLAGTLAMTAVAVTDVNSLLGVGRGAIESMESFANVLLPTVAAVTAATGAVTGAAARQMAAVLFCDVLINVIGALLIPLLYGYIAAAVACSALGQDGIKRIAALLKWVVTTALTVLLLGFVGYLTVSGVVAGSADAASIKAAKFAISGTIPVVGSILSDAAETILVSAGVLKGTVGVFGMIVVLGICLLPLLQMAVHYLVYKAVTALSATMGSGRLSGFVEQLSSAFGLVMAMTGACCLLLLIALVSSITVAAV